MGLESGSKTESRVRFTDTSDIAGTLACLSASVTVAALPWLLGGVIPLARVVLICGALLSAAFSMLSRALMWKKQSAVTGTSPISALPNILVPVLALAAIGLIQMRPGTEGYSQSMDNAVNIDRQAEEAPPSTHGSLSPADTRTAVGTLLAIALLTLVGFEHCRSLKVLLACAVVILGSGLAVGGSGILQYANDSELALNQHWKLGISKAFGPFVNPNGAAGWLLLCLGISAGWLAWYIKTASIDARSSLMHESLRDRLPRELHRFVASLSPAPVLALVFFLVLICSIAMTFSRGGILALLACLTAALLLRASWKRLPIVLLLLIAGAFGVMLLLDWLRIRNDVVAEITSVAELESSAASRIQHWLNSLCAVYDFPFFGTGLGSYRFATLPYQDDYTGLWFRYADNYFVEILVESGICGLICYVSIGLCGLQSALLMRAPTAPGSNRRSRVTSSLRVAIGTLAIVITVSQVISGFFDFGVGLPPGLATLCLLLGVCAGMVRQTSPEFAHEASPDTNVNPLRSGYFRCHAWIPVCVTLCLMAGVGAFLPDQLAAEAIHRQVVTGKRLLQQPIRPRKLNQIPAVRAALAEQMQRRPDDPEGLRLMTRLATAEFRWTLMSQLAPEKVLNAGNFHHRFQQLSVYQYTRNMLAAGMVSQTHGAMLEVITPALEQSQAQAALRRAAATYPLMPGIARSRAELAAMTGDLPEFHRQVQRMRFVEPHNARSAYFMGVLAADLGDLELAEELWVTSINLSRVYQAHILDAAEQIMGAEAAYEKFGPDSFDLCVIVALDGPGRTQRERLLKEAEQRWLEVKKAPTIRQELLWARLLGSTDRKREAIDFLLERVINTGDRLDQRKFLARMLEQERRYRDAQIQWSAVEHFNPNDPDAAAARERINNIK